MSFTPSSEDLEFITVRALYGDNRDNILATSWERNWETQHCLDSEYLAPSWYWDELSKYWKWPPRWLSSTAQKPGALSLQYSPSTVVANMLTPSATDTTQNNFILGNEVDITVSASTDVGTIESVRLFLNGELLDLPINFPQADTVLGQYSRDGSYGFIWTPDRPGTYELSVQAEDDSGRVSEITKLSTATVSINTESVGQLPVVRMTEPVPGGFGDNFPDYSYGSELFINVEAFDPDGDLEYVRIYLNGELLGDAEGRSGNTYVYKWSVEQLDVDSQSFFIQAAAKDNDGNIVRSSSIAGLTAANFEEKPPEVNVDGVFIDAEGVKIRALARSVGGSFSSGISRVQFFANGVTLDALSGATAFLADGFQEYVYNWTPTQPGIYSFYAMAVGGVVGTGDHYTISEPFSLRLPRKTSMGFRIKMFRPRLR